MTTIVSTLLERLLELAARRRVAPRGDKSMQKVACWDLVSAILAYCDRILLHGVPGTGKTTAGIGLALAPGQHIFKLTLTEEMPAAELRGYYLPVGGDFAWRDGVGIAAWRAGGRLVLDEIDHASAEVLTLLMVLLDDPKVARLTLPTGETVAPAPGFSVVATMNGDPEALPPALRDRFPIAVQINAVHPDALRPFPAEIQHAARETVALPPDRRISIRAWHAFTTLRVKVGDELAAQAAFAERAGDVLDALRLARKR